MKKIIFIRHGRAEDQPAEISDFERSLTTKGKVIARLMARKFMETEKDPGLFIASPAFRALETAYIFASAADIRPENVLINSDLYYRANMSLLLSILEKMEDSINTITLFGHNPAFTEIPDRLSGKGCEFVTKTSIVCVAFNIKSWKDVRPGSGRVEYFLKPEKSL